MELRISRLVAWIGLVVISSLHAEGTEDAAIRYRVDPSSASVLKRREIHVYVRRAKADLILTDITLKPNVILKNARSGLSNLPCTYVNDEGEGVDCQDISIRGQGEVELVFDFATGAEWESLHNTNLLAFEPGIQTFTLEAQVKPPTTINEEPERINLPLEVDMKAPVLAVTIGGAVGALVLALLRLVYRHWRGIHGIAWHLEVRDIIIAICGGALIAWSLTFLGGFLSDARFGVQISATSFKGGVIIGLLSYKLGDLLARKLWDKPSPRRDARGLRR